MTSASTHSTAAMRIRLAPLATVLELPAWREGLQHLAKDHRYYEIVAEALDFDSRALVVESGDGEVLAVQPCFFVAQDLLLAAPAPVRAVAAAVRRIFPRFLRLQTLMIGCAAGEGPLAAPLATTPAIACLSRDLPALARRAGARLIVWKDVPAAFRGTLRTLTGPAAGGVRLASMPATRLTLDFSSFDDYLSRRLSHAMRKNLRRKFKALAGAPPIAMTVTNDLGAAMDEALALYEQVFARAPLRFERLNKAFLQQLAARLPERVRFFLWRQSGRLVAFSLCLVHDGILYDEYLGLDYRVALDLHLYFVTFRDVLTWALARGLTAYHSTPLHYEPKLRLGFELVPLDLYVALPSSLIQRAARPFLQHLSPTRAEPVLAKFPNAQEMASGT